MAKQVARKTVRAARNTKSAKTVRTGRVVPQLKRGEKVEFRAGTKVAKLAAALKKGATIARMVQVSGMSEPSARSYLRFFEERGYKVFRNGERGASIYTIK